MAVRRGLRRPRANNDAGKRAAPEVKETSGPRTSAMLEVDDLRIHFPTDDGLVKAVDGVSFMLDRGKTLGIVGESGSGKSVTSLALLGLHRTGGGESDAQISGEIWLDGEELVLALPEQVRRLRGQKM